jgi:hypothetical protein
MMCKMANMRSYQSGDARLKMREILTAVERGEHVELKRYDTPTGVIVPQEWYERAAERMTQEPGDGEILRRMTSPTAHLIGLVDGMAKIYAPGEQEWQGYLTALREVRDELAALADERDVTRALPDPKISRTSFVLTDPEESKR